MSGWVHTMTSIRDGLLDILYPRICPLCDEALRDEPGDICSGCLGDLPIALTARTQFSLRDPLHLQEAWTIYHFDDRIQKVLHLVKYAERPRLAVELCRPQREEIEKHFAIYGVDLIHPIPLHSRKHRQRGYNQVEPLARALSEWLDADLATHLVQRFRDTETQTHLSATERAENMRGAFRLRRKARIAGKRILLVDDVLTTGSTANACAGVLLTGGAESVRLLAVAGADLKES